MKAAVAPGAVDWKWSSVRHLADEEFPVDVDLPRIDPLSPDLFT